jgi:hypothetical protein
LCLRTGRRGGESRVKINRTCLKETDITMDHRDLREALEHFIEVFIPEDAIIKITVGNSVLNLTNKEVCLKINFKEEI